MDQLCQAGQALEALLALDPKQVIAVLLVGSVPAPGGQLDIPRHIYSPEQVEPSLLDVLT